MRRILIVARLRGLRILRKPVADRADAWPAAGHRRRPRMPPSGPQIFVGAGDIAMCDRNSLATAALLDSIGGLIFTLGDNAYFQGTRQQYRDCYDNTWGRHKGRTFPVPGNHEYESAGALPYFEYFGEVASGPTGQGYYSFEVGDWHAVALNSNIPVRPASAQAAWLRNDLMTSRARCTIAYWHHPLFTSGPDGDTQSMREFWRILYDARRGDHPQRARAHVRALSRRRTRTAARIQREGFGSSSPAPAARFSISR